ncbi:MAG: heme ABC exporter ATP-binding protein CcmA [Pseudomonadota bacterium]
MTTQFLIQAQGLGALRGDRVLFRDLSFAAEPGDAIALRGANGAGKSTLLRILARLTRADAGSAEIADFHWAGHREGLKPAETPRSHLRHWATAWGADKHLIEDALVRMGLRRPADVPAKLLSAGQRRRTALARLLLEKRPVWLLDEPYAALDAEGRCLVESLLSEHRDAGGAIAVAIHGEAGFEATKEVCL